jgi:hypothetical protein
MSEDIEEIRALIRKLPEMAREELLSLWHENFGKPASPRLRRELILPILAYRIQERVYGGLDTESERRLKEVAAALKRPEGRQTKAAPRFKPGSRIIREWKGETHEVLITSAGYEYRGEAFKTLSPLATRITGTHWSGPAFFGTRQKAAKR